MPSKSARTRKSTNRKPTSRAVRDRSSPHPPTPTQNPVQMASPDQLQQIDPQLFALENTQAGEGMDNSITVNSSVERQFSPFSDAYESPSAPADTGEPEPEPDSQDPVIDPEQQDEDEANTKFAWTFEMEEALFNELVHQVELGKRADSGFKKDAWIAALTAVEAVTTRQDITLQRCKNKVESFKKYWRGFNTLRDQSGFGYNEETGLIEAPNNVWTELLKVSKAILLINIITFLTFISIDQNLNGIGRTVYITEINLIHCLKSLLQQESLQLVPANLFVTAKLFLYHRNGVENVEILYKRPPRIPMRERKHEHNSKRQRQTLMPPLSEFQALSKSDRTQRTLSNVQLSYYNKTILYDSHQMSLIKLLMFLQTSLKP
jgi:hypothetical protein